MGICLAIVNNFALPAAGDVFSTADGSISPRLLKPSCCDVMSNKTITDAGQEITKKHTHNINRQTLSINNGHVEETHKDSQN